MAQNTSRDTTPTTHSITVAKDGSFRFVPETLSANPNDIIKFTFYPTNHSVVYGSPEHACAPYGYPTLNAEGVFWSGGESVDAGATEEELPTYSFTVNDTKPIYLYCAAPGSCNKQGMVMIVNNNTASQIDDYRAAALQAPYILVPGQSKPSTTQTSTPTSKGISTGAIVGIAIGGVALIVLIGLLFFAIRRRSSRNTINRNGYDNPNDNMDNRYSTVNSYMQPPIRETVIIPMTETEKAQYLERLNGTMSPAPMSPRVMSHHGSEMYVDTGLRPDGSPPVVQGVGHGGQWHGPPVELS